MISDLALDFHNVVAAMPEGHLRRRMLELLEEAIRRDIHFIGRQATTLFQSLWNACWRYDWTETAKRHGASEDGWPDDSKLWLGRCPELREPLQHWHTSGAAALAAPHPRLQEGKL